MSPHRTDAVPTEQGSDDAEAPPGAHLRAVPDLVEHVDEDARSLPAPAVTALRALRRTGIEAVRRYHRLDISGDLTTDEQVLFVANHGFGGIFDLNVFATLASFDHLGLDRPVTLLTHDAAWTLKVGRLLEPLGCRPASWENARAAFRRGHHVLVLPGGERDAFKKYRDRNTIVFAGRTGFARLAMETEKPIVPIVTAGAGDSLVALSDGQRLVRALRLDKALRTKALPISISAPWGLTVGGAGVLPYLPMPAKLDTRILPALTPEPGESAEELASRVRLEMQDALTSMAENPRFGPWSRRRTAVRPEGEPT